MADGRATELSLADTVLRAHEIRELFDESPLVTVALHRLLLAILHRNFGPANTGEWFWLWRRGRWDEEKLGDYFTRWHERFELLHPKRPFYQVPEIADAGRQPVSILFQELATGNNTTLLTTPAKGLHPHSILLRPRGAWSPVRRSRSASERAYHFTFPIHRCFVASRLWSPAKVYSRPSRLI